ncbi:hypothetical protein KI387_004873, partial [Taxus chinensis]
MCTSLLHVVPLNSVCTAASMYLDTSCVTVCICTSACFCTLRARARIHSNTYHCAKFLRSLVPLISSFRVWLDPYLEFPKLQENLLNPHALCLPPFGATGSFCSPLVQSVHSKLPHAALPHTGDILVNSDLDDASRWLWVTEDAALTKREEKSSLDGQNYIIVTEEDIVEGIALFMARIVAANPQSKNLSPEQLQSTISSTFANMKQTNIIHKLLSAGKVIYTVASWGLALYGLYTQRHIVKAATKAVVKS